MKKQIRLNAFAMNCVAHQSPGLWTHPRDRTAEYNRLPYWIDLAKTLERGRFDGLFLADVLGVYDVFGGSPDAALRNATQTPANEPLLLIPAMAAVTENLGFGVTSNLSYEPPYPFARRMSTLDHLTEGRIGWNVVTGYLDSAARGAGKDKQTAHDDRYDVADEYMEVVYKLWEGSWEDDAALRDRAARHLRRSGQGASRPARGQPLPARCHSSQRAVAATHPGAVSGRHFAARTAVRRRARRMRVHVGPVGQGDRAAGRRRSATLAAKAGRNPAEILMFSMMTIILGRTEAEAQAKYADYRQPHQSRGRADADVRLDRRRFLDLRPRPAGPPRPERRRPHRDGQHHPRRSGPGLDRARGRRSMSASAASDRSWSARPKRSPTRSKPGSTQTDVDGLNVAVCGFARRFRGHHRHAGAGTDPARALQGRLSTRARCARNCSATAAPGSRRRIRPRSIGRAGQRSRSSIVIASGDREASIAKGAMRRSNPIGHRTLRHRCFARARNDGIAQHRPVHHHLDQFRAGPAERRCERRLQLPGLGDPDRLQPERFGDARRNPPADRRNPCRHNGRRHGTPAAAA